MIALPESEGLRVLVTGATGYVGSRLIPELISAGHTVVAATRTESGLDDFSWAEDVEKCVFDIEDEDLVQAAVRDVAAVIYLVHSLVSDDFMAKDRAAAKRVAAACEKSGVSRIVYLSGLVPPGEDLSDHLRSRLDVEKVFLSSSVPTVVLRAAMVIGAGSVSFDLLRLLSERVPLLTPVPAWMRRQIQPIAVEDVVHLIVQALRGTPRNQHYDVGGDETLTYPELLAAFAPVAGLRRYRFLVPWLSKKLVGRACAAITGMPRSTVISLVESLGHDMVCQEDAVRGDLVAEDYRFTPLAEALERSLYGAGDGATPRGDIQASSANDAS